MHSRRWNLIFFAVLAWAAPGCGLWGAKAPVRTPPPLSHYQQMATEIEFPDVATPCDALAPLAVSPLEITPGGSTEYWNLGLQEAMQVALSNARILRELNGLVLRSPGSTRTIYGPAIQEMDPRFGVDAALSAFDAEFSTRAFFENNNRQINNQFFGGGTRSLRQDQHIYESEITKRTAAGTVFTLRQNTDYDANNAPGNRFPHAWNANIEAEFRQSLLQGAGVDFNRIAGPNGIPGQFTGVVLARLNTDISLADFEAGVHEFASNVENAYWDLYFAYRDLDAKIKARDAALETWRHIHALYTAGRRGGEEENEAEAREQYYRFHEEVQNAWNGRVVEGTRTNNGSSGGTLRPVGGVRVAERRLRLLMGLPITDGRLIRPADEAAAPPVVFDWDAVMTEALSRRVELRRQRWLVKRREMELIASRNFLLPRLDLVGRQRWRGFGRDLFGEGSASDDISAVQDLFDGDYQEWQLGVEFTAPFGRRRGHVAVRAAELQLTRERVVLQEQEREVVYDLTNAIGDVNRAWEVLQTSYNRRLAARQQLDVVQAKYEVDKAPLDVLLDAQRRLADDESRYYAGLVEYMLSMKNVHYEKGSLLDYNEVYLSEGGWPGKAYGDAARRESLRKAPSRLSYILRSPPPVSLGPVPQQTFAPETVKQGEGYPEFEELERVSPPTKDSDLPDPAPQPDNPGGEPLGTTLKPPQRLPRVNR